MEVTSAAISEYVQRQESPESTKPLIVDWGCGGSGFLRAWPYGTRFPWDGTMIIGVDVNPYSVSHAVSLGFQAYTPEMFDEFIDGGFHERPAGDERTRIMTFWDVFEHLQDPRAFLKQYKPDIIVMSLPCLDGFYEAFGQDADLQLWKHYRPLEHLWNFTEGSLIQFLQGCGYKTTRVYYGESSFRKDPKLGEKNIMTIVSERVTP
jgi:hypothetical protein